MSRAFSIPLRSEAASARFPIFAVAISMVGFICIKSGRDAVFFSQGGLARLPLVYILVALTSIPAAMIHLSAMKRWGARRVRTGVVLLSGSVFLGFVPFADLRHPLAMQILYILVPVVFAAVFAAVWLLAADLLEGSSSETTRWTYSRVGAASMLGGAAGGMLASFLSHLLAPRFLIAVGGSLLWLVARLISGAHRRHPLVLTRRAPASREEALETAPSCSHPPVDRIQVSWPLKRLLAEPYIRGLFGVSALGALAALLIDFQFYASVTFSGHTSSFFFANFYTVLNLASLSLQLLVAPRIQSRLGVAGALSVLPLALLGGLGVVAYPGATLLSRSLLKITESGVKASVHRSVWEQVFLPIQRGRPREMTKVAIDGVGARVAEGLGAALLYALLRLGGGLESSDLSWMTGGVAVVAVLWIGLTLYLQRQGCSELEQKEHVLRLPDS
ncbi:MAG: hypothetical protein ACE5JX_09130 [Acidobacteriota bacterium]